MLPVTKRYQLAEDLSICPLITGMWQVSGAHGPIDPEAAIEVMFEYHDSGFTTWDLADHYGPAEEFIGEFRRRLAATRGESELAGIQAFTKWVPQPGRISRATVEAAISRSQRRMNVERIDVLQFHWWDYSDENYIDALRHLAEMREEGRIRHLALTNFDTEHVQRIVDLGIPIVSNQVQYSLIDRRPEVNMAKLCRQHGIHLLTYGTVCGGLLSERYLNQPEPSYSELNTSSLQKYKRMINAWGGWALFQELLGVLKRVADSSGVGIAEVGIRCILDRPSVAGVIVGARLGVADHREDNARVFDFELAAADRVAIETALAKGNDLYRLIGDCGDEYRH
jgi:aryl-alcohol dehydrogenase-like predicted oxidoreductase